MFRLKALSRRNIAFACIAAICFSLIAILSTASIAAADTSSGLTTASSKKTETVYVLTKQVQKFTFDGRTDTQTQTIAYTSDGLVKKLTTVNKSPGQPKMTRTETLTYGSKYQLKKGIEKLNGGSTVTTTYKCDKKGRVIKSTLSDQYGTHPRGTYKYNSKGQLTQLKGTVGNETYKYDSAGRLKSVKVTSFEFDETYTNTYKYDKYGFLTQINSDTTYKNTVKNGLLKKRVETDGHGGKSVTTYTYKEIKVPAAAAKMVKSQQEMMVQGIQSFRTAHR